MKDKILTSVINFLNNEGSYSENDLLKIRYGLEGIYLTITKLIVILILSILLGILKEVAICLIFFNIIRYFSFGFHAEKSYECLLLSLFNFILIPLFFLSINRTFFVDVFICCLCLLVLFIFAPADTVKRPLKNKKKCLAKKALTLFVGLIYFVLVLIFNSHYISDLLISVLVADVVVVNPITYFLFRQPYNNYKN